MDIQKRIRLEQVGVRIDPAIRKKVKQLANKNKVTESDIYRTIIDSFFSKNVSVLETNSKQIEYKEVESNGC